MPCSPPPVLPSREEAAIEAAVNAIDACFREPQGVGQCRNIL